MCPTLCIISKAGRGSLAVAVVTTETTQQISGREAGGGREHRGIAHRRGGGSNI